MGFDTEDSRSSLKKGRSKVGHEAGKMDCGTNLLTVHSDGGEQRLSGIRLNSPFPRILITLGHTLRLFAKLIKTNMGKLLEAAPTISQLLKVSTQQLKGRRGANSSCFV